MKLVVDGGKEDASNVKTAFVLFFEKVAVFGKRDDVGKRRGKAEAEIFGEGDWVVEVGEHGSTAEAGGVKKRAVRDDVVDVANISVTQAVVVVAKLVEVAALRSESDPEAEPGANADKRFGISEGIERSVLVGFDAFVIVLTVLFPLMDHR